MRSCYRIRPSLHHGFEIAGMMAHALGLLQFGQGEIARVSIFAVHQPARHLPVIFQVKLAGDVPQLELEMGEVPRRHGFGVDPGL